LLQQRLSAARAAFEQAVAASPTFSEGHGSLAVVNALEGRHAEAQELLRKARGLDRACASAIYADALLSGKDAAEISRIGQAFVKRMQAHSRRGGRASSGAE
jgi:Flp pilus assembly protein TadD